MLELLKSSFVSVNDPADSSYSQRSPVLFSKKYTSPLPSDIAAPEFEPIPLPIFPFITLRSIVIASLLFPIFV